MKSCVPWEELGVDPLIERSQLRWATSAGASEDATGPLHSSPLEVFGAIPARRRPQQRPRSDLAGLGSHEVHLEELEEVSGERDAWVSLPCDQHPERRRKWMDGDTKTQPLVLKAKEKKLVFRRLLKTASEPASLMCRWSWFHLFRAASESSVSSQLPLMFARSPQASTDLSAWEGS